MGIFLCPSADDISYSINENRTGKAWCSQMGCNFIMYVPAQTFEKLEKENLLIFELSATN